MNVKKQLYYIFDHIEEIVTSLFFCIMCIFVFLQIFSRYITNNPFVFTEEVSRFSYLWLCFVGNSLAFKNRTHIRISYFVDRLLAGRAKNIVSICINMGNLGLVAYLFFWGIIYINFTKMMVSPALGWPMLFLNIALPIGFALSFFRIGKILSEDIKKIKDSMY
jgi:TRAP-type C4-dicarboxylate transport system permease small subunit